MNGGSMEDTTYNLLLLCFTCIPNFPHGNKHDFYYLLCWSYEWSNNNVVYMCEHRWQRSVHLKWWYCTYGGCGPTNQWQLACRWSKGSGSSAACIASTFSLANTLHPRETQITRSPVLEKKTAENTFWSLISFCFAITGTTCRCTVRTAKFQQKTCLFYSKYVDP
jgi:hypothetical protein